MIRNLHSLPYSAKQTRDLYHFLFWSCEWSMCIHFSQMTAMITTTIFPFERAFLWYRFLKIIDDSRTASFHSVQQNKLEGLITFLGGTVGVQMRTHPSQDKSNDHHHHFPIWEGLFPVSVDRLLQITHDSESTQKDLSNKTNPSSLTTYYEELLSKPFDRE